MKILILAVVFVLAISGFVRGDEAGNLISAAARDTAAGKWESAEANYRQAAEQNPLEGRPALARFFRLTGQNDKLAALIQKGVDKNLPVEIQARTLAAGGQVNEAVALLESSDSLDAAGVAMLAGFHKRLGNNQKANSALWNGLVKSGSPEDKILLFHAMRDSGALLAGDSPTSLVLAAEMSFSALLPERNVAVEWFDPMLIELQHHSPAYFKDRELVLEKGDSGAAAAWVAARLLVREEHHEEAWDYLQSREAGWRESPVWPLLAEELAELARILRRPDDAERYLKLWAEHGGDRGAVQRAFREAALAMTRQNWTRANELFSKIDPASLRLEQQRALRLQWMKAALETGQVAQVIDVYARVTPGLSLEEIDTLNKIIFDRWILTEWHWALENAVREKIAKTPGAPPELWLLAAESARQARLTPNQIEALFQYAQARPGDMAVLKKLCDTVRTVAAELADVDEKDMAAPQGERERLTQLAEQSLQRLIRALPYEPENYQALIELYQALGRDDDARRAPEIAIGATANAQVLGVAGYALALSDYPDEAMKYYDKALALDPQDMSIWMNRVACLTRIDRLDEADQHYREILEKGHNGRAFHAHEMVGRIWAIAQHQGTESECLIYFESLPERIKGDWLAEAMLTAANAAALSGRLDEVRQLTERLEKAGAKPDDILKGWENYALALLEAGRLEDADAVFKRLLNDFGEDAPVAVTLRHARAEIMKRQGKSADAVLELQAIARAFPSSQEARDGLFRAGDLAGESGDVAMALKLYDEFLKSGSTSFGLRREAEEKMKALRHSGGAE